MCHYQGLHVSTVLIVTDNYRTSMRPGTLQLPWSSEIVAPCYHTIPLPWVLVSWWMFQLLSGIMTLYLVYVSKTVVIHTILELKLKIPLYSPISQTASQREIRWGQISGGVSTAGKLAITKDKLFSYSPNILNFHQ